MADEAYRAVFLRVHPTGKMVLSLTTESDGNEAKYAQQVAEELGIPALDVKVMPADESRFGTGHGFNTSPSGGTPAAISSATPLNGTAALVAAVTLKGPTGAAVAAADGSCGWIAPVACAPASGEPASACPASGIAEG